MRNDDSMIARFNGIKLRAYSLKILKTVLLVLLIHEVSQGQAVIREIKLQAIDSIGLLEKYRSGAKDAGNYYDGISGTGYVLKTNLYHLIKGHTVRSYDDLWTDMQATDNDGVYENDNTVLDMYSENPDGVDPYTYNWGGGDQCGNYSGENSCYNREHSFPKSWFNDASPMYTDLFHLYPTDGYVNGRRGNYPFGEVTTPDWTSQNGSKLGTCSYPGYTGTVFEPIDEFKGDFARTYFYMATRYENVITGWNSAILDGSADQVYEDWYLQMMIDWHQADPVSQKEIDRNDAVFAIQDNRNPFIDHPEYVCQVWSGFCGPSLATSSSNLSNFSYITGNGPSAVQDFELSGSNLDGTNVTITSTSHYEISTSNAPFVATATIVLPAYDGAMQSIYVRLKEALSVGTYSSEILSISGGGDADGLTVSCSGEVLATPDPEPTNQPTTMAANAISSGQINLTWTDAVTGLQAPDSYLILANTSGTFTDPSDETDPSTDSDMSDGSGVFKVSHGTEALSVTGLNASTQYFFKMWPYTNSSSNINFKLNGTIQTANATTQAGDGPYSGSGTFTKITSIGELDDGYYVVVNENDQFAMNNTNGGSYFEHTAVSPSGGSIVDPATSIVWKIETDGGGKTIFNEASSRFVSYSGSSNRAYAVASVSGDNERWTFSYTLGKFTVNNIAITSRQLSYNASAPRFAAYGNSGQQELQLYKMESVGATPTLAVSPSSLTGFTYVDGAGPSGVQSFELTGSDLDGSSVTIAASTNYEISASNAPFNATSPITLSSYDGTSQTIYVRLKSGLSVGTYNSETIAMAGGGDSDGDEVFCSGEVTAAPDPEPTNHVTSFTATANGSSQIDLSWTDAATGSQAPAGYVIYASDGTISAEPTDGTDPSEDTDLSDGSALVKVAHGGGASHSFNGLSASTPYYFKIWPYTNSGNEIDFKTEATVPLTNETTDAGGASESTTIDFETAGNLYTPSSTSGSTQIDVFNRINPNIGGNSSFIWAAEDIAGNQTIVLDQIDVSGSSDFTFSIDLLTPNSNDWDSTDELLISYSLDGEAIQNLMWVQHIPDDDYNEPAALDLAFDGNGDFGQELPAIVDGHGAGVENTFETFTTSAISLSGNSTLDITLSFNGLTSNDEGIYIDNITITETTGGSSPDSDSDIIAIASSESASVSSIENTSGPLSSVQGTQVWQVSVRDGGATDDNDSEATLVTGITFTQNSGNEMDAWDEAILSADLFDGTTHLATGVISGTQIQFTGSPVVTVPDDASKILSLRISISTTPNTSGTNTDGDDFVFELSRANVSADASGSQFTSFTTISSTNEQNVFDIAATALSFVQQPSNTAVNAAMDPNPSVQATDGNGNVDEDYSQAIEITSSGTMTNDPVSGTWTNGAAVFADVIHTVSGSGFILTATSGILSEAISSVFGITENTNDACASDLFISEYHEPSGGNNKGLEIFNGTGLSVDLSNYYICFISNGGTAIESSYQLSGTLSSDQVVCVYNDSDGDADFRLRGDVNIPWGGATWNGDDAVYLCKGGNTNEDIIDAIGDLPPVTDPGSEFSDNGIGTANTTLLRKSSVSAPTRTWSGDEWIAYAAGTYDDYGSHAMDCPDYCSDLIISEYVEADSDNKAIELFNGTGAVADLSDYQIRIDENADDSWDYELILSGVLNHGQVYVIANELGGDLIAAVGSKCNMQTNSKVLCFDGDDKIGLFKDDGLKAVNLIDVVGDGITSFSEKSLDRNGSIVTPTATFDISEWTVNDPFTYDNLGGTANPLPVCWGNFSIYQKGEAIELVWVTHSEENNHFFEVTRSTDGRNYKSIAKVPGAGNSTATINYSFRDAKPELGKNYYQLKQVDFDGTPNFSKVVSLGFTANSRALEIKKIEASDEIRAVVFFKENQNLKIEVINSAGKVIYQFGAYTQSALHEVKITPFNLEQGMYFLRIRSQDESTTMKFVYPVDGWQQ